MKKLLRYIWQLPQNLVGLIVVLLTRAKLNLDGYHYWRFRSGLSLGHYIFINREASIETIKHEEGHQRQSARLGWLYLPVIGIPSLVWACLKSIGAFKKVNYYSFYTERRADELAHVRR